MVLDLFESISTDLEIPLDSRFTWFSRDKAEVEEWKWFCKAVPQSDDWPRKALEFLGDSGWVRHLVTNRGLIRPVSLEIVQFSPIDSVA